MSIQTMQAVWQHSRSEGRARLVLLAIADHQGEIGAWPSIATLARMANTSDRSVQRDIAELHKLGELDVQIQNAPTNRQYKSNLYWVKLPGVTEPESGVTEPESGVTDSASGVTDNASGVTDSASGVTAVGVLTLNRTITKPLINQEQDFLFEDFWNQYPKKADKRRAQKSFASALKRAKFEDLIAGAIAYKSSVKDTDFQFVKNPATWLNADAWENTIKPSAESEAAERASARKQRDLESSRLFLDEQKKLTTLSRPAPICKHGNSIVSCGKCYV
jgi:hypothetical protein